MSNVLRSQEIPEEIYLELKLTMDDHTFGVWFGDGEDERYLVPYHPRWGDDEQHYLSINGITYALVILHNRFEHSLISFNGIWTDDDNSTVRSVTRGKKYTRHRAPNRHQIGMFNYV